MRWLWSFQERGARNSLLLLTEEERRAGVMAASAGGTTEGGGREWRTVWVGCELTSRWCWLAGVVAVAGNHALALSWHGSQLRIPVTVFMPVVAPLTKVGQQ